MLPLPPRAPVSLAVLGALLLAGCSSSSNDSTADSPETSATPTSSPADEIVAPLLEREPVDVPDLALPKAPKGVESYAWRFDASAVRSMAAVSQDEKLWTTPPGQKAVAAVAVPTPPEVAISMKDFTKGQGTAASVFWGPTFGSDAQPKTATVVDGRWTTDEADQDGVTLQAPVLELTTVYTFESAGPVVVRRQFSVGTQRSMTTIQAFRWSVNASFGGLDTCRLFTDGEYAPAESPDVEELQDLVDHVVKEEPVELGAGQTDLGTAREKACA